MPTFSPKQLHALQNSDSRFVAYVGAVRSGKSFAADWKFADMCRNAPVGALVICGKSQESIKRNVVEELINMWGDGYIKYYPGKRELTMFGRQVYCIGANDERAAARIKGATFSGGLADEATELPESFFRMLTTRLSRDGSQLILTTNPDSPFHWLKVEYLDRAADIDLKHFHFVIEDNPSLTPKIVESLKRENRGLWYKRLILGHWCLAEGSVYDFFTESEHVIEYAPSYAKYFLVGIDYGTTNACAYIMLGFNDEVSPALWVEKEYYFDSREEGYQKTDAEYAEDLRQFVNGYPVKKLYIDPSAASFKLEIKRAVPTLSMADAKNDVLNGIRTVSTHLSCGNLRVLSCCPCLIKEFQSYVWDAKALKRGIDMPLKAHDHGMDALRYAVFSHFGHKTDLKGPDPDDREKDWYKRRNKRDPSGPWGWGWRPL